MSYVTLKTRPSAASLAAVVGVHAAAGMALLAGLTVSGVLPIEPERMPVFDIPQPPPPLPPPSPEAARPETPQQPSASPPLHVPRSKIELSDQVQLGETTDIILPPLPIPRPGPEIAPLPLPEPVPSATATGFAAVGAKPRNDPGKWLRDSDYRTAWAHRELTGTARFRLDISRTGTITGCRVTGSTGHRELDDATCALLRNRAKFEPARGREGEPVAGSYDGAVRWVLPD